MKTKLHHGVIVFLLFATFGTGLSTAIAQGTAFTYQGQLQNNGSQASGTYNLTFTLFSTNITGVPVAGPVTNNATAVSNGLFTTTVDFGVGVFTGSSNWLEIAVTTNGSASFSTLAPRQQLTPTPYAITAGNLAAVSQFNTVVPGNFATVGGGDGNTGSSTYTTVAGGYNNTASGYAGTVGGGTYNNGTGVYSTIGGGIGSSANGGSATVGGGEYNNAGGLFATVGGGYGNLASGYGATVGGGVNSFAEGDYSFAAGYKAQALHDNSFVWNDGLSGTSFSSTAANQFSVRAAGGVVLAADVAISGGANAYHQLSLNGGNSNGYLYGSYPKWADGVHLGYNYYADASGGNHVINTGGGTSRISAGYGEIVLAVGNVNFAPTGVRVDATTAGVTVYGTFNNSSDRNAKQDFAPVSPAQILDKVLQLPVSEWSYKTDAATRHIGPMGQDFYSTFNIGTDEKHIAPIDEGGVAFLAIQGLDQKLESEAKEKAAEIQELKQRLAALEKIVLNQKSN